MTVHEIFKTMLATTGYKHETNLYSLNMTIDLLIAIF